MKTIIVTFSILFLFSNIFAQDHNDALRFSERYESGDARTSAMSGAFGGLGGNISATGINPGGLGLFSQSAASLSTEIGFINTSSNFMKEKTTGSKTNFAINHFGFVSHFDLPNNDVNAKSLNFTFSINKRNDFNNITNIEAINNSSSMVDDFAALEDAQIPDDFYNELAYQTYLTSYDSTYGTISDFRYYNADGSVVQRYGQLQSSSIRTNGSTYEYDFGLGTNFSDVFSLGIAATINHIRFSQQTEYSEYDINKTIPVFDEFIYQTSLSSIGNGIMGKFGFLVTPNKYIRIGGAVHTPSVIYFNETYRAEMSSYFDTNPTYDASYSDYFDEAETDYNYVFTTPFRYYANLGIILKNYGVFDIDIENIDYSSSTFDADDSPMTASNKSVQKLQNTTNIRTGLELKFGPYYVRGGAALYGNPYTEKSLNFGEYKSSYSGGFGLKSDGFFFDIAYVHTISNDTDILYYTYEGNPVEADSESTKKRIVLSFGFNF